MQAVDEQRFLGDGAEHVGELGDSAARMRDPSDDQEADARADHDVARHEGIRAVAEKSAWYDVGHIAQRDNRRAPGTSSAQFAKAGMCEAPQRA